MRRVISFNKTGYDPFIDYLKAYSIFCVVFAHCLPVELYNYTLFWVWGSMQVPMFVLIQTFHAYKKETQPHLNYIKLIKRIILPFIAVQLILLLTCFIDVNTSKENLLKFIVGGGKGPGTYYFWIYLQIAILLPVLWKFMSKASRGTLLVTFLVVSIGTEVLFSIVNLPDWIYRLFAIRYVFLIYLAYTIWIKESVIINWKTILLSLLSISVVLFFNYTDFDLEPLFYNTAWETHRWICYFYVATLMVFFLWLFYKKAVKVEWLDKAIKTIGKCSYEIFLIQMLVFVFLKGNFNSIEAPFIRLPISIVSLIVLSLVLGVGFKYYVIDKCKFLRT